MLFTWHYEGESWNFQHEQQANCPNVFLMNLEGRIHFLSTQIKDAFLKAQFIHTEDLEGCHFSIRHKTSYTLFLILDCHQKQIPRRTTSHSLSKELLKFYIHIFCTLFDDFRTKSTLKSGLYPTDTIIMSTMKWIVKVFFSLILLRVIKTLHLLFTTGISYYL